MTGGGQRERERPRPPRMIGVVLSGRYQLQSKLGSGGMSTVYLAQDQTLDRPVAVKVLHREISDDSEQLERFRREARAAAKLSHPNLVTVIDAGEDGGTPYIVFEYVPGDTLKQRIQRQGPLPIDEAVAYAVEIGRGLAVAHARKLVHRDVKPQNVLIDSEGRAKVTDFGIARSLESQGMTETGRVLGTTDYVSPEQAMGEDVDERSDVYSLGVVLYEMLTGQVPYHAETQVGVAMRHINEEMPDVQEIRPEVSAALAAVVDRATAKDLKWRHSGVGELLEDLESTLDLEAARGGAGGQATAVLETVPAKRRRFTRPGRASGAGIAMGLIGAALIVAALVVGEQQLSGGGDQVDLAPDAAAAFDPSSTGGDGSEHNEDAKLAIDGNATGTSWPTETYDTEDLGGKPGVGLSVDAGDAVEASAIEVRASASGWDAEIRAAPGADQPPDDLSGWTTIGEGTDLGTKAKISIESAASSRFYLLWLTKLPSSDEGFKIEISDTKLLE